METRDTRATRNSSERPALSLAVAATFTAEPLEPVLQFWLDQLGYAGRIELAPYNQVFQALLDPASVLGRNASGVNLVLVRFEDWLRFAGHASGHGGGNGTSSGEEAAVLRARIDELIGGLRSLTGRSAAQTLLWLGPESDALRGDPQRARLFETLERELDDKLRDLPLVQRLSARDLAAYPVDVSYDARRDELGHIPYTPLYFSALGTAVARRIHALKAPPMKVIALDCDNTLWSGVVGEEGVDGLQFPPGKLALQRAVIEQQARGVLVCLLSKNAEADVLEVFERRPEMALTRKHVVAQRIDWQPKAQNLALLAEELNLGLDSFVFIDDNPVECAEMRATYPQVLTFQLPDDDAAIEAFTAHLWPFDRASVQAVTEEDRQRTRMYQDAAKRNSLQREAQGIGEFLAKLELQVDIVQPLPEELPRVAQLTARTNQFNFTTKRRSEAEIQQLGEQRLECLRVSVRDRFGDYGLVGVMIFGTDFDSATLRIDTLLLSCRVLGRGVEHAMLRQLGQLARERGLSRLEAPFAPTKKNQPALNFLESLGAEKTADGERTLYRITAEHAAQLEYRPGQDAEAQLELARTGGSVVPAVPATTLPFDRGALLARLAGEWRSIERVHAAIEASAMSARPELSVPWAAPRSAIERELVQLWQRVLHLDRVGVNDDFAALGGTSLMAAQLFAEIDEQYGVKLPMTTILDAPTVALLAPKVSQRDAAHLRSSLKLLRKGSAGGRKLFLVHDGDGETLLYMNLARRLPSDVSVYGIEPMGDAHTPMRHTRIPDMAAHYVELMTREAPDGPYLIGGMCAGGTIAFEMGLQLEARGKRVGLVALLDASDARAERKRGLENQRRLTRFVNALRGSSPPPPPAPDDPACAVPEVRIPRDSSTGVSALASATGGQAGVANRWGRVATKLQNFVVYEARTRFAAQADQRRFQWLRRVLDRDGAVPVWLRNIPVRTVYDFAEREYEPRTQLEGRAVLFRATRGGEGGDEAFMHVYADPLLGWTKRVRHGLQVFDVPGGHSSMLQEPEVAVMAEHFAECLASDVES
ncbi:MAG TPA: HAD-IIIC family phosphatase [Polyangiales bacterium]|nr:HAD-IIIC family phosphatase [Polyangiales bacterium]